MVISLSCCHGHRNEPVEVCVCVTGGSVTNREQEHLMPPHKDAELGCDVFTAVPPVFGLHTQIKIIHKDCQESQ